MKNVKVLEETSCLDAKTETAPLSPPASERGRKTLAYGGPAFPVSLLASRNEVVSPLKSGLRTASFPKHPHLPSSSRLRPGFIGIGQRCGLRLRSATSHPFDKLRATRTRRGGPIRGFCGGISSLLPTLFPVSLLALLSMAKSRLRDRSEAVSPLKKQPVLIPESGCPDS